MENVKMKPMVYKNKAKTREILYTGLYKGMRFYLVSYQTHPCAYVMTEHHAMEEGFYPPCHGGITFDSDTSCGKMFSKGFPGFEEGHYIGWDYDHLHDYNPAINCDGWWKWTTEEIYEEVKNVIDYIKELK